MDSIRDRNAGLLARTSRLAVNGEQGGEKTRRLVVTLVFIIYWLLILEGALRKWIFPEAFNVLFFVRDPFVFIVYVVALSYYRDVPGRVFFVIWIVLGLSALLVGVVHLWIGETEVIIFMYGWRNYFYYIPLAFIIGATFRESDLYRLIRQTLFISIPVMFLVYLQIISPPDAVINAGVPEIGLSIAGTARGFVRTYGTFTSSPGQTLFAVSLIAMLLATWMLPDHQRPVRGFLLLLASGAVTINLVLSGSRGGYIHSILIMLFGLLSFLILPNKAINIKKITIFLIITTITVLMLSVLNREALEAVFERVWAAYYFESEAYGPLAVGGRIILDFTNFGQMLSLAPLFGHGVGWFGNAFSERIFLILIAEDDWSRNILELGPVLGLVFLAYRISLVVWLTKGAIGTVKRARNPGPLLFVGFIGVVLLIGQITCHGSVNGYGWLFAGFCMAINQIGNGGTSAT